MQKKDQYVLQTVSFFILLAVMLVLVGKLFLPYASVLLWSAVIYILVSPLYNKIVSRMDSTKKCFTLKKRLLAGFFSLATVLLVAGILFFVIIKIFGQGKILLQNVTSFLESVRTSDSGDWKSDIADTVHRLSMGTVDISKWDIEKQFLMLLSNSSNRILGYATNFAKNTGAFILSLAFFAFSLYFFYIDGPYLLSVLKRAIPINSDTATAIFAKIKDITTNLFKGLFLVSFYQCLASFIIYLIFGVQSALLLAILTFFSSFLPLVGCGLIWLPVGIGMCFTDSAAKGIAFLIIAGGVISSIDNILRPFFLKDRIKIHPLLIFFSMLGGVRMFAFDGIVLGPMIVILFFTILDMALEAEDKKEGAGPSAALSEINSGTNNGE